MCAPAAHSARHSKVGMGNAVGSGDDWNADQAKNLSGAVFVPWSPWAGGAAAGLWRPGPGPRRAGLGFGLGLGLATL